jgi:hypothetical protein
VGACASQSAAHEAALQARDRALASAERRASTAEAAHTGAVLSSAAEVRVAVEALQRNLTQGSSHARPLAGREAVLVAVATLVAVETRAALGLPETVAAADDDDGSSSSSGCGSSGGGGRVSGAGTGSGGAVEVSSLRAAYRLLAATAPPPPAQPAATAAASVAARSAVPVSWAAAADPAFPFPPLAGDLGDLLATLGLPSPAELARKVQGQFQQCLNSFRLPRQAPLFKKNVDVPLCARL